MNPYVTGVAQVKQVVLIVRSPSSPGEDVVDERCLTCANPGHAGFAVAFGVTPSATPFPFHITLFETRFDFQWLLRFLWWCPLGCFGITRKCRVS